MSDRQEITFTPDKVRAFKRAYAEAVKQGVEQFKFEDKDFLVVYAKFLIEFLDQQFKQ